jgi:hypothetical protein
MRGPQVAPRFARELIEGDQSRPVLRQALPRLWGQRVVTRVEWRSQLLARGLGVGLWHGAEYRPGLRLTLLRHGIQHSRDPMVPAALLGRGRLLLAEGRPDAQMPIGNRTSPRLPSTGTQITPHGPPRCLRFALSAHHGPHHRLAMREGTDHDEPRGLGVFEPGFHLEAVGPHIDDFDVVQPTRFPDFILGLPLGLQTYQGGRRERGRIPQ